MNELTNQKLLILGASNTEITLVQRAKELGIYTIVTDSNTDWSKSPAKYCADEAWDISWSDQDALEAKCREVGVNGVTAGYSEFRVENQIRLTQRLGLPCCTTMEQLEITRNKDQFKAACRRNGVPVVREYESPEKVENYPVIVKPVDRGGSIGISVAANKAELDAAYAYAMDCSVCKKVIIEDFITDGIKVDVYYAVSDGQIQFLTSNDVIFAAGNGMEKIVQSAWTYHSVYEAEYLEQVDASVRKFIQDMEIKDGYLFFSSFRTPRGFVMFEMGQRLCGGHTYAFLPKEGKANTLDLYIRHALTGSTAGVLGNAEEQSQQETLIVNVFAKAGTLHTIRGFEEVKQLKTCCLSSRYGRIGQVCADDKAILSKVGLVTFSSGDLEEVLKDVERFYETLAVTGENGEDLVYDRLNLEAVRQFRNRK